jgi:hypothetical protein
LVDHEINNYAGYGDIEPQGEGPSGDDSMLIEFLQPGAAESDEDEGNDDDGEDGMGEQEREIDWAYETLSLEVDDLVNTDVVDKVGNEKGAGNREGGEHECFVYIALAGADGDVATG